MASSSERRSYDFEDDHGNETSILEQVDFQYYLRVLRKFKWPVTLFTAAVTALASYYAFTAVPIYSATSTLLIESQRGSGDLVQFQELVELENENQDYYQTQYELLRSRGLAVRVVDHLDLWRHPELSPAAQSDQVRGEVARREVVGDEPSGLAAFWNKTKGLLGFETSAPANIKDVDSTEEIIVDLGKPDGTSQATLAERAFSDNELLANGLNVDLLTDGSNQVLELDRQTVVENFQQRLNILPIRKTKLVKISFQSADPAFAALVANTVGDQYIRSYLDAKLELTTKASTWLTERLTSLKQILDESEDRLISFKQANGLVDVDGSVGRLNEQELLLASAELAQARSLLSGKADLYREVQALKDQPELLQSIPAIQADPLVQNVKIQQGQAQRQLDELRNRYGERHPRVVDASSQIASLKTTLQGHMARVVGSVSKDYQLARQQVASIEGKLAAGKQEIQAIGTKKFELDELEREVTTNRAIYDEFFSRISEAKSADGLESANARISDLAVIPRFPVKPRKQAIIGLSAIAALLLAMLMAFLYEHMDDTIKSTNDIEERLGLRLLGILPLIKGGIFGRTKELPLNPTEIDDKNGTFHEAVNTARTALCMDDGDEPQKIITVTSSVPGEGKSTTSINLAYSLAQIERVLLIDCDLRRPTVARAAGLDRDTVGLTNLITRSAPASKCIKRGCFDGKVDVLPSGPIPSSPLELLSSKRFEKILEQLSQHYDRIVIDSAPTQAVSDALVLSRLSDALVYCVKSNETSINLVKRGIQRLRHVDAPIAGVIVTQVDVEKLVAYGGDHFYQGYYDYYGYTEKGSRNAGGKLKLSHEELLDLRTDDSEIDIDIDYGMQPGHRRPNGGMQENEFTLEDEFDMTARVIMPKRQPGKGSREQLRSRTVKDKLDIL